jgi:hypothetical protein
MGIRIRIRIQDLMSKTVTCYSNFVLMAFYLPLLYHHKDVQYTGTVFGPQKRTKPGISSLSSFFMSAEENQSGPMMNLGPDPLL